MVKSKWAQVEKNLFLIKMWARDGVLEKNMAKKLGVSVSTFEKYKLDHSELREALKESKEIADYEVENSLYKKCVGTFVKVEKAFKCKEVYYDDEGRRCEREEVKTAMVDEFIPPDTMAMLAWLNNRKKDKWRRNAGKEVLDEKKFEHEKTIDGKRYW